MKTKLLITLTLLLTLFTSCQKNETILPLNQTITNNSLKNLNTLEGTTWNVIEFKHPQKGHHFIWNNGPQITFSQNFIYTEFNDLTCDKYYETFNSNGLKLKPTDMCPIGDRNTEIMLELLYGEFTWAITGDGNLDIKNQSNRVKVTLKPTFSITTSSHQNLIVE